MISFSFLVSFYEHFRKISTKRNIIEVKLSKINDSNSNYLYNVFRIYCFLYWFLFFSFHFVMLFSRITQYKYIKWEEDFLVSKIGLILLIISSIFKDFSLVEHFLKQRRVFRKEGDLKREYNSLIQAYYYNDEKIIQRIVKMLSKLTMDQTANRLLNFNEG